MLALPGSFAADKPAGSPAEGQAPAAADAQGGSGGFPGLFGGIWRPYKPQEVPPVNPSNSSRIDALLHAGNLYLTFQDALALTLENNLDIEIQRYVPQMAEANVLRTKAGGYAAPPMTSVLTGPASVGSPAPSPGLQSLIVANDTQIGITPPSLDPALVGGLGYAHTTAPQISLSNGTAALINRTDNSALAVQQYFSSGTIVSLGLNNSTVFTNSPQSSFSPGTSSSLAFTVTQHLLQGFGPAITDRQIRIARHNRELSDLTFKAQVIATVSAVADLYWDLVSFGENVRVKRDALAADEKLLADNRRQVEVGTLAPISVVQAEAQIAADQQALTVAETQLLQQETILKNAISRTGTYNPAITNARVVPLDHINVPDVESITPIQDATALAEASRPELAQARIQVETQRIANTGTRNELLPTLDLVGSLQNNGLAGAVNPLFTGAAPPAYIGGYGTVFAQIFGHNYPNYSIALNLNVPLRNRTAQADYATSELLLRQQELAVERVRNQVRVEVQNAIIGLQQARAQYQAATKQRVLEEQTVDAEQKKLDMGVSTTYNVILTMRDLVTAQSNEVAGRSAYAKAHVEMDRVTGQTLYNNQVTLEEAFKGKVSRPPAQLPANPPAPQQ